ncbi:HMA2 domain-containing protein, partial [Streptomyces acidiscabies]|uniref:HMA2 domain-containing protein n=1 Tax=Streptomyces acidiscabies TaxID=42234 RepID=UPI00351B1249
MSLPLAMSPTSVVPGRQRWRVDGLLGNPALARLLELTLAKAEGIEDVRANPVTGSVLVRHDRGLAPRAVARIVTGAVLPVAQHTEPLRAVLPDRPEPRPAAPRT